MAADEQRDRGHDHGDDKGRHGLDDSTRPSGPRRNPGEDSRTLEFDDSRLGGIGNGDDAESEQSRLLERERPPQSGKDEGMTEAPLQERCGVGPSEQGIDDQDQAESGHNGGIHPGLITRRDRQRLPEQDSRAGHDEARCRRQAGRPRSVDHGSDGSHHQQEASELVGPHALAGCLQTHLHRQGGAADRGSGEPRQGGKIA